MSKSAANPFAFPKPITLDTLGDLFAHHRSLSGGWSMEEGAGGDSGGAGDGAAGGAGAGAGGAAGSSATNATDDQGRDLGFPTNTRVAEMTADQQANYWRHQSQKHEGRYKNLTGDRSFDDVKKDLDELSELRKAQQTPAEQALSERYEAGKADAIAEASNKAATAIFRATLAASGHKPEDIEDLVSNFNVANFVKDGDVDTDKLATFATRFTPAGTATTRTRNFGGGTRPEVPPTRGAAGKAEAAKRFGSTTS